MQGKGFDVAKSKISLALALNDKDASKAKDQGSNPLPDILSRRVIDENDRIWCRGRDSNPRTTKD